MNTLKLLYLNLKFKNWNFNLIHFAILLFPFCFLSSQGKEDYIWTFGYIGPPDNLQNFVFDFNKKEAKLYKSSLNFNSAMVSTGISDKNGRLMAYTNGCLINDRSYNLIENGEGLNPGFIRQGNWCESGYPGGNQSHIFLTDPGDENIIWLFHNSYSLSINYPSSQYLRISKIDLNYNNGLGKVTEKNTIIVNDSLITFGEISAVKHSNNKDWWIVSPTGRPDTLFRTFLLSSKGLAGPFEQHIGKQISYQYSGAGGFKFNPQGTKIARYGDGDGVYIYDFDRTSGKLSNFIEIDTPSYYSLGGLEFSPSGRYLYVSTRRELFQYDMQSNDIKKSIIRIDSLDGFSTWTTVTFGCLQTGPDCKIYVIPTTSVEYFGIIHSPDQAGIACNFKPHSLKLPTYNALTRVYHPHYRQGTPYPDCDSTIRLNTSFIDLKPILPKFIISPNPTSGQLHINWEQSNDHYKSLKIIDIYGHEILTRNVVRNQNFLDLNLSMFSAGVYFIQLLNQKGSISTSKVILN